VQFFGKLENARFLHVGLFQGITNKPKAIITLEMKASNNPNLQIVKQEPTLFCTAYKKNRFYLFTKREPDENKNAENERDVFNEKPTKEEIVAAIEVFSFWFHLLKFNSSYGLIKFKENSMSRLATTATIHTTMGDIQCTLYYKE